VYAQGQLAFYGPGHRHGYARDYSRAHGAAEALDDPFALHLADNATLRELYLDAEAEDGYYRDRNVFAPGVTIEDDMAVLVTYDTGATMTYHLTAYSPAEGYRVMINGSGGRLELNVEESTFTPPRERVTSSKGWVHGDLPASTAAPPSPSGRSGHLPSTTRSTTTTRATAAPTPESSPPSSTTTPPSRPRSPTPPKQPKPSSPA
jgi:hypothetical protein